MPDDILDIFMDLEDMTNKGTHANILMIQKRLRGESSFELGDL